MEELIQKLEEINSLSTNNELSSHYIGITKNNTETVLKVNKQGLVWLALEVLKLAEKQQEGRHLHIDECGLADKAETNIIITYKSAEWE